MSLYIHVGQCGNQLAIPLWKIAEHQSKQVGEATNNSLSLFDELDGYSRAILIDSEPKVVTKTCKHLSKVRPSNVVLETSGCGNNWSMGFASCIDAKNDHVTRFTIDDQPQGIFSTAIEAIRKESERFETMRSLVMIHSVGGGTGSGMGSALLQHLRDDFPSSWIVPIVVGPFSRGDNPLQYYNTMFSFQYLNEYADAVVYSDNDILTTSLNYNSATSSNPQEMGAGKNFEDMNHQFAEDIASVLFPLQQNKTQFKNHCMGTFISTLCPLSRMRFLRIGSSSQFMGHFTTNSSQNKTKTSQSLNSTVPIGWDVLTKRSVGRLGIERGTPHGALAAYVTIRGCSNTTTTQIQQEVDTSFLKYNKSIVPWHVSPTFIRQAPVSLAHTSRSVALAVNRSEMGSVVRHVSRYAAIKYHSKAYLHAYRRYGVNEEDFAEAFEAMNNIATAYDELRPGSRS